SNGVLPWGQKSCCWGTWLLPVLPGMEQQSLFNAWNFTGDAKWSGSATMDTPFRYSGVRNITGSPTRGNSFMCPDVGPGTSLTGIGQTLIPGSPMLTTSQNYVVNYGNLQTDQQASISFGGVTYNFGGAPFTDMDASNPGMNKVWVVPFAAISDGLSNTM